MKLTVELNAPPEAGAAEQIEIARQAAVDLLEEFERRWPGFRKRAAKEDEGRFWLYVNRRTKWPIIDKLVVVASECRAKTETERLIELQRVIRQTIVGFDQHYPGLYKTLTEMMAEGKPLGLFLRRLIGGRPVDGRRERVWPQKRGQDTA